jgi:hypothetical protein
LEIGVPCLLEPLVIQTIVPYSRFQVMDLSDEIALSDFLFDKTHVEFLSDAKAFQIGRNQALHRKGETILTSYFRMAYAWNQDLSPWYFHGFSLPVPWQLGQAIPALPGGPPGRS